MLNIIKIFIIKNYFLQYINVQGPSQSHPPSLTLIGDVPHWQTLHLKFKTLMKLDPFKLIVLPIATIVLVIGVYFVTQVSSLHIELY